MPVASSPILLVEDDADLVACLRAVIEDEGIEVLTASDGRTALDACRAGPVVAFVDLHIEGDLTGAALLAALRGRLPPTAKLILLSGERDLPLRARELGADGWLEKPFGVDQLLATIHAARHLEVARR